MHQYLRELTDQLRALLLAERSNIRLDFQCEPFTFNVDRATSIGLIVNELISNAAKHAFPNGASGTVAVTLTVDGNRCALCVADNGAGRGATAEDPGVGLKLVNLFVAQLDGTVTEESAQGLRFTVRFPLQREDEPADALTAPS
jgi:two-component sensor histidine kinase